jgi:hypothetical protein
MPPLAAIAAMKVSIDPFATLNIVGGIYLFMAYYIV